LFFGGGFRCWDDFLRGGGFRCWDDFLRGGGGFRCWNDFLRGGMFGFNLSRLRGRRVLRFQLWLF